MATDYPASIDPLTPTTTPTSPRNAPSLSGKVNDLDSTVVALQVKVGTTASADTASLDYKTTANAAAAAAAQSTANTALANGVTNAANIVTTAGWLFGSGVPGGGTGVDGNIYINTATGIIYRKTAGTWAAIYTPAAGGASADPNLGLYSGLKAWNFDLQWTAGLFTPTSGRLYFQKIAIPAGITANSVKVLVQDITGTTTTGFYGALYNSAGTLLSQSATVVPAFDVNTLTLGAPQVLAAGNYFACIWWVFSGTAPKLYTSVNNNSYQKNVTLASPNLRVGYANTGLTTTAPGTMGAQTTDNAGFWVALG